MTQSMCGWLVWFPALFLVQIWVPRGGGGELGGGLPQPRGPQPFLEIGTKMDRPLRKTASLDVKQATTPRDSDEPSVRLE